MKKVGLRSSLAAFSVALAVLGASVVSAQDYYYDDGSTYVTTTPSDTTLPGKPTTLYNLDGTVYAQGYTTSDGQIVYDRGGVSQTVPSTSGTVVYDTGVTYAQPSYVVESSPVVVYESSPSVYYDSYPMGSGWGWSGGWGGWGWDSHRYRRPNYYHRPPSYHRPRPPSGYRPPRPPTGGRPRPPRPPSPPSGGRRPGGRR